MSKHSLNIDIIKNGLLTSLQDLGRIGHQHLGVPVGGAMDQRAMGLANFLVGNDIHEPVLEVTLLGPSMCFSSTCQIAITGADISPALDRIKVPLYETINVRAGQILTFGKNVSGCRAYISVRGKWKAPKIMGSVSSIAYSDSFSSVLRKGTQIQIETAQPINNKSFPKENWPDLTFPKRIQVVAGPEFELFSRKNIAHFFGMEYTIGLDSNRMGYRLNEKLYGFLPPEELVSSGVTPGTIQVTGEGQPIILMADAQTSGGYYRIANVLPEDIFLLAQAKPGDKVSFQLNTTLNHQW